MEIETKFEGNTTNLAHQSISTRQLIIVVLVFLLSIGSAFTGGYYLNNLLGTQQIPTSTPTPKPETSIVEEMPGVGSKITSGKEYYDDTLMAITSELPRRVLVGTATRQEVLDGVNQNTRASFFDGTSWTRKLITKNYDNTAIHTNAIISDWTIQIDPSRVLKQSITGKLTVGKDTIDFDTGMITNNLGIRSLPGFTKFISTSDGKLTIDGSTLPAKILYTRIYSNNSQEMQFYDTPLGLTTHWLAFWDDEGNVYHVDSTHVDKPTDKYQTHQFAVMVDQKGRVAKTFDVSIDLDSENPPKKYSIQLGEPINTNLTFAIGESINKAPNNSYTWYMSEGTGQANGISGYGVVEYIHN